MTILTSTRESLPADERATLKRQVPSFVAIGAFGYLVDASVTYALARGLGVDPMFARLPAFAVATMGNFALNRTFTFADSGMPLVTAFVRYIMVCAAGLAVNYITYASAITLARAFGIAATPPTLPVFVACGTGVAMFVTFFGFRFFAFRNRG